MDLFHKLKGLQIVKILKMSGMYPFFRALQGSKGNNVVFNDQELVMMGSNNYLGLTHDNRVIEAAVNAVRKWGSGCTGSRFLNGNLKLHEELEAEIAEFYGYEASLVYATGFMANQGAITALVGEKDHIFSDEENHACIIEGCKLTKGKIHVFKHGDMAHLEELLKSVPLDSGKLIIVDGVFSMTGHLSPYNEIHALAKKYNARTYVDDAHGAGTIGEGGRGTASHFNLKPDILMGTFSKSFASQGGYVCGSAELIEWLRHKSRTFMFSAALAPASAASALEAIKILRAEPELVNKVRENALYLKNAYEKIGLNTMGTETCVVPVFIGADEGALYICQQLLEKGIFTTPVVYPAVPKGQAVIRCSVMATHTKEDLDKAIAAFESLVDIVKESQAMASSDTAMADMLENSDDISFESISGGNTNVPSPEVVV
ncbi:MAG: pyridoxal phosphate-dependent aminotransferase family protein [Bdellovibrionota bacterium]